MSLTRSDVIRLAAVALVAPRALRAGAADEPRRKPDLGDAAEGAYEGDVISDSKGSSKGGVRLTVTRIGKNLVRIMLENAGFAVHDLGRDVAVAKFVDTAGAIGADLVCLSTLMTSTMDGMGVVVERLREARIASKVLVGGGPISAAFAKRIGADGHGRNAAEAVKVARSLVRVPVLP